MPSSVCRADRRAPAEQPLAAHQPRRRRDRGGRTSSDSDFRCRNSRDWRPRSRPRPEASCRHASPPCAHPTATPRSTSACNRAILTEVRPELATDQAQPADARRSNRADLVRSRRCRAGDGWCATGGGRRVRVSHEPLRQDLDRIEVSDSARVRIEMTEAISRAELYRGGLAAVIDEAGKALEARLVDEHAQELEWILHAAGDVPDRTGSSCPLPTGSRGPGRRPDGSRNDRRRRDSQPGRAMPSPSSASPLAAPDVEDGRATG